jgi:hypothetical protein
VGRKIQSLKGEKEKTCGDKQNMKSRKQKRSKSNRDTDHEGKRKHVQRGKNTKTSERNILREEKMMNCR